MTSSKLQSESDAVRWFGWPARRIILIVLSLYTALFVSVGAFQVEDPDAELRNVVGADSAALVQQLGTPRAEAPDGRGGRILFYDRFRVVDNRYARSELRVYIAGDGRVYEIERD